MYLSRLVLNPHSRQVQSELARPYEMHRTLLRAFPDDLAQGAERVLFRVDTHPRSGIPTVLAQSWLEPDWSCLPATGYLAAVETGDNPAVKPVALTLHAGQLLAFRLRANPTQRLSRSLPRGMDKSKRVGLYKADEQLAWLARKGTQHGFRVVQAAISGQERIDDPRQGLKLLSVQFDGLLQVTDPQALTAAVATGIGSGKAFGFGLLSLAPAR